MIHRATFFGTAGSHARRALSRNEPQVNFTPRKLGWRWLGVLVVLQALASGIVAKAATAGDFIYQDSGEGIAITGYTGSGGAVTIPDSISGKTVTQIGSLAFWYKTSLTSVTIPGSVRTIGDSAFSGCTSLSSLTIPDSVTEIGTGAFSGCRSLTSVTLPTSVSSVGSHLFWGCTSLASVTLPHGVTSVGSHMFSGCTSLTSVTLPDTVRTIGDSAFSGCTSLASLTIPDNVTEIGSWAFSDCTSLTSVTIPDSVFIIMQHAFSGCRSLMTIAVGELNPSYSSAGGVLYNKTRSSLIAYPPAKAGPFLIPDSVTSIGEWAFRGCTSLTSVTIPDSVTSIREGAFSGCTSLTSVTIPDGVTFIEDHAFYSCMSLTSVTIPNAVIAIGEFAFARCPNLTSVTIPDSVTYFHWGVFMDCTGLTSVTIGNSVTSIGRFTFSGCTSLASVTIPDSVTEIGPEAFSGCTSLTSVTIPDSVTSIGGGAFQGCTSLMTIAVDELHPAYSSAGGVLYNKTRSLLIAYPAGKAGPYVIPDSVTSIGGGAFSGCTSLTSVTIPDSVTYIGWHAFSGCMSLTSVAIPQSVTAIGGSAFRDCASLTSIPVHEQNPVYSSAGGVLFDKTQSALVAYPPGKAGPYVVPDSVTSFRDYGFSGCTSLTSVTISDSVTSIGGGAFQGCTSLITIAVDELNPAYSSAGGVLYNKTGSLLVAYPPGKAGPFLIPDNVTSIGAGAFSGCTSLTSVAIPETVTSILAGAFGECRRLTSVYFTGDAPGFFAPGQFAHIGPFHEADQATVYYRTGTTGWGDTYAGRPAVLWTETDDLDHDAMNNLQEKLAGTDPMDATSRLAFEGIPRPDDLVDADKTGIGEAHHALYFRTIPGITYEIQSAEVLGGGWSIAATVTATSTQKRVLMDRPPGPAFYRIRAVPLE